MPNATTADGTAPADVTDVATGTVTTSSVALSWTAPGDDGATGTATTYDVRYSTSTITAGNWASATPATGEPAPSVAGSAETFTVTGLSESTTYYFAIKTSDEVPNESGLSNVPSAATATTAPDAVTDLATGTVTTSSVDLSWTAPGDDGATGTATTYDVRYSTSTITAGNWASATQAAGEPAPSVAGQRRDVHGHGAERVDDLLLRDQDVGRSAERECDLERAEHSDSGRQCGRPT